MSDRAGTITVVMHLANCRLSTQCVGWRDLASNVKTNRRGYSDARMTLSLMVQPEAFRDYLERKGSMAKGVGFCPVSD